MSDIEFTSESKVFLIDHMGADVDVARAAWVSNNFDPREKEPERVEGLINFLIREKHTSPFEHVFYKFMVQTPLFVAREHQRHRTQSYNEVSGRYTTMRPLFYVPGNNRPMVQEGKIGNYTFAPAEEDVVAITQKSIMDNSVDSWGRYLDLKDLGVANEVARDVLSLNLITSYYASCNMLNLMRFLTLRTAENALYEIREVAGKMEEIFKEHNPITYNAWRKYGI